MPCSSHVVRSTFPGGRVHWQLHCYGSCARGECVETYVTDPEPGDRMTTVKTCACPDDVDVESCPPPGIPAGTFVKACRVGLRYGYNEDGTIGEPLGPVCVGPCPDGGGACKQVVAGSSQFEGVTTEVVVCRCG